MNSKNLVKTKFKTSINVLNLAAKCFDLVAKSQQNALKNQPKMPFFAYFYSKNKKPNKNNAFPVICTFLDLKKISHKAKISAILTLSLYLVGCASTAPYGNYLPSKNCKK